MWRTTLIVCLTVFSSGALGFSVDMQVPATAALGSRVVMTAPYELDSGEYIQDLTWSKDGTVFLSYSDQPFFGEFYDIDGLNIYKEDGVLPNRVVLENVGFGASGTYTLFVRVALDSAGGSSSTTFQQSQTLEVGGDDGIGNRFGGASSGRPVSQGTSTFISSSSSAGNQAGGAFSSFASTSGDTLGNRFGGGSGGSNTASSQAAQGLDNAVNNLQQAVDRLNAIASGLTG